MIHRSTLDLIHNTPLLRLPTISDRYGRNIYSKLECQNPGGSVKDRVALHCVTEAELRGELRPGSVLIESTSGSMGVGLAIVGGAKGYPVVCVIDPKTTHATIRLMELYGAQVVTATKYDRSGNFLASRLELVQELLAKNKNYWWLDQYSNPDNPATHFQYTGPEIVREMDGKLDWVVIPVGTGGLLGGLSRYLKSELPACRIMAVDAKGSSALGGSPGPRRQVGIGSSLRSQHVDLRLIDRIVMVNDDEAFLQARYLALAEHLILGCSSGSAFAGLVKEIDVFQPGASVVFIAADSGLKYIDTIYDDAWANKYREEIR